MVRSDGVQQPQIGLKILVVAVVPLDLGAHRQHQAVRQQRDVVLDEDAEHAVTARRVEVAVLQRVGPDAGERGRDRVLAVSIADAGHQIVTGETFAAELKIGIVNIAVFVQMGRPVAPAMIEVGLQREAFAVAEGALPPRQQIAAGQFLLGRDEAGVRWRQRVDDGVLTGTATVVVTLHRHRVVIAGAQVDAESDPRLMPVVVATDHAVRQSRGVVSTSLGVGPPMSDRTERAAVARTDQHLLFATRERVDLGALGGCGRLGDDVDHAVDRICAPQRRTGAPDHLDALDVLEHGVLHIPIDAGEGRRIGTAPVDQHQQLVGESAIHAAGADRPDAGADARHLDAGHAAQQVGDRRRG